MNAGFSCVDILHADPEPPHFYIGFTEHLQIRRKHNKSSGDRHTTLRRPWHIRTERRLMRGQSYARVRFKKDRKL